MQAFHCDIVSAYQVEALNLNLDVDGNSVTHIAAARGKEDIFKVCVCVCVCACVCACVRVRGVCVCVFVCS